jgi:DNA replication protein DnaC
MKLHCDVKTVIPDEYKNFQLDEMIGDPVVIDPIKLTITDYLKNLSVNEKNGAGLLLYGVSNGTGKTWIAYYILRQVEGSRVKWSRQEQKEERGYTQITSIRCFDYINLATNFQESHVNAVQFIKTCPFLLFDELSPSAFKNNSGAAQEYLASLIDYRVSFNLPTIYTSNCENLDVLKKLVGPTLYSRITYKATPVNFTGPDVRPLITEQMKEELLVKPFEK